MEGGVGDSAANLTACLDSSYGVSKPGSISSKGSAGCNFFHNTLALVFDMFDKIVSHEEMRSEKPRLSKSTTRLHFYEDRRRFAGRIGSRVNEGLY